MAVSFITAGGGLDAYVPSTNAIVSGALQVEFTRAINTFAITQYAQIVPVSQMTGYYLRLNPDDNVRIKSNNEFNWPLGDSRPMGKENEHAFVQFTTQRFAFPFFIPTETQKQAAWDIVAAHARSKAQLAMTARTSRAASVILNSSNEFADVGNYAATAGAGSGGPGQGSWYSGTEGNGYIQGTIQFVLRKIAQSTAGAVRPEDINMVLNPTTAYKMSQSPEIRSYVKNYPAALPFLQNSDIFSKYGLPPYIFGVKLVVDDSVLVSTQKKTGTRAETRTYAWGDDQVAFLSRPGGLVGVEGSTSFSTVQIMAFEDMTVENWTDPNNRRIEGRVIDNSVAAIVAPQSGYYIASVAS
jgi:hypothetical protein